MKSLIVSAVVAVILSAASVTAQTTACAAQSIVEACLGTTEGNLKLCSPTDYTCLCEAHKAILTCYANCPSDLRAAGAQSNVQAYCAQATLYQTSTSATNVVTPPTSTAVPTQSSETTSEPSPDATANSAAPLVRGAPGLLAAAAGVVGVLL